MNQIDIEKLIEGLTHDDRSARALLTMMIKTFQEHDYCELLFKYGIPFLDCSKIYTK